MSILDRIIAQEEVSQTNARVEIAKTNVLRQQMMEKAGELQKVHYIGPNGTFIPGFYSAVERAFLPEFSTKD